MYSIGLGFQQFIRFIVALQAEPLVEAGGFPDGIEVQPNRIGARHNSSGDDVVAVEERASHGLTDAVDIDGRRSDEGDDEAGGGSQEAGNHENPEPTHVEAVVGRGNPLAELLPGIRTRRG